MLLMIASPDFYVRYDKMEAFERFRNPAVNHDHNNEKESFSLRNR